VVPHKLGSPSSHGNIAEKGRPTNLGEKGVRFWGIGFNSGNSKEGGRDWGFCWISGREGPRGKARETW